MSVSSDLVSWPDIAEEFTADGTALLVGNGASQNVWSRFGYASLIEEANLTRADRTVFREFDTNSFEAVLSRLANAIRVCEILAPCIVAHLEKRYESVRQALISGVSAVHIPATKLPDAVIEAIALAIKPHGRVYSVNYDLLIYWAIQQLVGTQPGVTDFCRGTLFVEPDPLERDYDDRLQTFFLHGGIHLYTDADGNVRKLKNEPGRTILDQFAQLGMSTTGLVPLLVGEGTSERKMDEIRGSRYLAFAHRCLEQQVGCLTVFGHSLSTEDRHIVEAIAAVEDRRIAVSVWPRLADAKVRAEKARVLAQLPMSDVVFFASNTHPLGSLALTVAEL